MVEACAWHLELCRAYKGLRSIEDQARTRMGGDSSRVAVFMQMVLTEFVDRLEQGNTPDRALALQQTQVRPNGAADRER